MSPEDVTKPRRTSRYAEGITFHSPAARQRTPGNRTDGTPNPEGVSQSCATALGPQSTGGCETPSGFVVAFAQ
jgi:hypothetical protein